MTLFQASTGRANFRRAANHAGVVSVAVTMAFLCFVTSPAFAGNDAGDWDRDGIRNDRDLWPRGAELPGQGFRPLHPAGTLIVERDTVAIGMRGRSKVERWGSRGWKVWDLRWREEYSGTKGTRNSDVNAHTVRAAVELQLDGSPWRTESARRLGRGPVRETVRYQRKQLNKRYSIDYDLRSERFNVTLQNHRDARLDDAEGRPLYCRTLDVAFLPKVAQSLVVQFSLGSQLWRKSAGWVPAFSWSVYRAGSVRGRPLAEGLAVSAELSHSAFEARVHVDGWTAARTGRRATVLLTPVWVRERTRGNVEHRAIEASRLQIGALGMEWILKVGRDRSGADSMTVVSSMGSDATQLVNDPRRIVRDAQRLHLVRDEALVAEKRRGGRINVRLLKTAKAWAKRPRSVVHVVENSSKFLTGDSMQDVIEQRYGEHRAQRYAKVSKAISSASLGSVAVIQGGEAYLAWKEGDRLKMSFFGTQAGFTMLWALGEGNFQKMGGVGSRGIGAAYQGIVAWEDGRRVEAAFNFGKVPLWAQAGFHGDDLVSKRLPWLKWGQAGFVGVQAIDAGLSLHKAFRERDSIRRQSHFESAAATAINCGIFFIPNVGAPLLFVWWNVAALASFISPDSIYTQIFASPGAAIVFYGTVIFTNRIPSVISEEAFRKTVVRADQLAARQRERPGRDAVVVVPSPDLDKRSHEIQRRR